MLSDAGSPRPASCGSSPAGDRTGACVPPGNPHAGRWNTTGCSNVVHPKRPARYRGRRASMEGVAMQTEATGARDRTERPPRHCPACGQDLSRFPYYQLRSGPLARRLRALARALIPVMAVVFVFHVFSESFPTDFHDAFGHYVMAFVCGPSMLIYTLALPFPKQRRVICLRCSWYRDYPYRWGPFEARSEAALGKGLQMEGSCSEMPARRRRRRRRGRPRHSGRPRHRGRRGRRFYKTRHGRRGRRRFLTPRTT